MRREKIDLGGSWRPLGGFLGRLGAVFGGVLGEAEGIQILGAALGPVLDPSWHPKREPKRSPRRPKIDQKIVLKNDRVLERS